MECPKCGYLGFDDAPRCRNCSYDFALASTGYELALDEIDLAIDGARTASESAPDSDWSGGGAAGSRQAATDARQVFDVSDLDALLQKAEAIGVTELPPVAEPLALNLDALTPSHIAPEPSVEAAMDALTWPTAPASLRQPAQAWEAGVSVDPSTQRRADRPAFDIAALDEVGLPAAAPAARAVRRPDAPAFTGSAGVDSAAIDRHVKGDARATGQETRAVNPAPGRGMAFDDDAPLVRLQQPRAPVAVRKTPMSPKLRAVARPAVAQEPAFDFLDLPEPMPAGERPPAYEGVVGSEEALESSPPMRRLAAAVIDGILFAGIDLAVLYLTFRIVGLSVAEWRILPVWPLVMFLLGMKVSYAAVFTAMGGQTIGKMAAGIRVVSMDDRQVDAATAVRRTLASSVAVATVGLGYLPGLIGRDRRAIHDRVSGTRVVMLPAA